MRKKPKYHQGFYTPENPSKYKGNVKKIIFRSGLELKYFRYCDVNPNVLQWNSEEVFVPYVSIDGRQHRYFIDLWMEVKTAKTGEVKQYLAEIKPKIQTKNPSARGHKEGVNNRYYKLKMRDYMVNVAKWDAANKFAKKRGIEFIILTEEDI